MAAEVAEVVLTLVVKVVEGTTGVDDALVVLDCWTADELGGLVEAPHTNCVAPSSQAVLAAKPLNKNAVTAFPLAPANELTGTVIVCV